MSIQECINILNHHDMLEEAEKIADIAQRCQCQECRDYRNSITLKQITRGEWDNLLQRLEDWKSVKIQLYVK